MPSNETGCPACARGRLCTSCGRRRIITAVAARTPGIPMGVLTTALDAVAAHSAAIRSLAAALAADPDALTVGAPPVVGRLVGELQARGVDLPDPVCSRCGRTGKPLTRSSAGGMCARCRRRQLATACVRCGVVKPVAGRDGQGRPVCARCADRPQRVCGKCGRTRRIARRARDGQPDICDSCFRGHEALCSRCGRRRPCSFASGANPICARCAPRATATCAHCGADRPPTARWPEGPVCDPCYIAALRRRGTCATCKTGRRLVHPPGPNATICADCAGVPVSHTCTDCGIEDRAYERGRCAPCALNRRTAAALSGPDGRHRPDLEPVYQAITTTDAPRTALNWLRNSAGAALLTQMASGAVDLTHQALDEHPRPGVAGYLRAVLVANNVLPQRDEQLTATEQFLNRTLTGITRDSDRRLVHSYATWQVLRRLRATAARGDRPRTYTHHARTNINAAVDLLNWLADRETTLADTGQADIDTYLARQPPSRYRVRDFLQWAAATGHTGPVTIATPGRNPGPATDHDERWAQIARLLHDDTIELTDRVAGALLLLYGQHLARIVAITHDQIKTQGPQVFLRLGTDDLHIPEPLAQLIQTLARDGRPYTGVGTPSTTRWLFPGLQPGRPLTAARLGDRLRKLGIRAQPARRAALTHLAAQLPAAVIAGLLGISPTTAVHWVHDAGGDWNRYAAQLTQDTNHQPRRMPHVSGARG